MKTKARVHAALFAAALAVCSSAVADEGQIKILSPLKNSIVSTSAIYVTGTAVAQSRDIGIVVNDLPAQLDIEHAGTKADPFRWFAEVGAPAGRVKLKARLVTPGSGVGDDDNHEADGDNGAASTRHVQFSPSSLNFRLLAAPDSGVVPLTVQFRVAIASDATRFEIDFDGDGVFDSSSPKIPDELSFTYTTPGLRIVTARLTTATGTTTASTAVAPQSFATMNTLLLSIWSAFADTLAGGSIDTALERVAAGATREKYREPLVLIRPSLSRYASEIRRILPVSIDGTTAHYLLTRIESGEKKGYHVYFARDEKGLWKIVQF